MDIVWHKGKRYKVRAYPSEETAQRQWKYINEVKADLFVRCHGRIDHYLVLDYVPDANSHAPGQRWDQIWSFLAALAKEQTHASIEEDFDQWCNHMESNGIFLPRTVELLRRYHRSRIESLGVTSRLEYYDTKSHNFVTTKEGKFLAIDEKHLAIGPHGVGLLKRVENTTAKDFLHVKKVYSTQLDFSALQDPEYRDFLLFYKRKFIIDWRSYKATVENDNILWLKRELLRIIARPLRLSLREMLSWELDYRFYRFPVARHRAISSTNPLLTST